MKLLISFFLLLPSLSFADEVFDLLKASDRFRGGLDEGITWDVHIDSMENGAASDRDFSVKAKDHDAKVDATAPARNLGEIYMLKDRDMWFFKPSLKKPVAVSSRQKLSGQAANGDIASTHYSRDYTATIEKTDNLNGEKVHVLLLKAKAPNLTYDQIRYWIQDKSKMAVKAEFLTLQGRVFKIGVMKYDNEIKVGEERIPFVSELTITDAKYPANKSIMTYKKPKMKNLPKSMFNISDLSR